MGWFSSCYRYPELRELELEHLARTLLTTDSDFVLNALAEKITDYTCGQLIHAKEVLPALHELTKKGTPFKETFAQPPTPSKLDAAVGDWGRLKNILTWSLTTGSFLDSQFYARDSNPPRGTPSIRPIYFCSMAGDRTFSSKLLKCEHSISE